MRGGYDTRRVGEWHEFLPGPKQAVSCPDLALIVIVNQAFWNPVEITCMRLYYYYYYE